ncbi:hypothetical protein [Sinorhizobium meliloti]|uniref:hypothetical protein n=1 Tax=Rhizobium meliloti TaxID=382 RepID=UPI001294D161|nr:hypothetical protein [Sinorhizobium meliloti]MQW20052.1 hypothetical protein [Sinorhizobium meliloti]
MTVLLFFLWLQTPHAFVGKTNFDLLSTFWRNKNNVMKWLCADGRRKWLTITHVDAHLVLSENKCSLVRAWEERSAARLYADQAPEAEIRRR